jgi:hypothetical protein
MKDTLVDLLVINPSTIGMDGSKAMNNVGNVSDESG